MGIDNDIIKGCINKQRDCQKKLYDTLSGKMLFVCFRYCKNRDDAEDLLQEGFIKVFKHINTFKFEGSFEGWVRRIMVNTAINFITQQKQKYLFDDIDNVAIHLESELDAITQINEKDLLKILSLLPDGYRTVFNLFAIEGYSHKEIADLLNITEGTSKSQLSKAKAHLKKLLYQHFDADLEPKSTLS